MKAKSVKRLPAPQKAAREHRETVAVFLGAGASKAFGYPLTGELLPNLLQYLEDDTLDGLDYNPREIRVLRRGLEALLPGLKMSNKRQLPLITDVLSLIDHSLLVGTSLFPTWSNSEVEEFRGLVEQFIADMVAPEEDDDATPDLIRLANWMTATAKTYRLGVITTNYDVELDLELFSRYGEDNVAEKIDFGMSWREPAGDLNVVYARPRDPALAYYKLHGSLNWLRCSMCEYIYVNVLGSVVHWAWDRTKSEFNTCHCNHWPLQSVLVAPSYVRDMRDVNLLAIWRNALDMLASADHWVIVGYSLPPEDLAIRAMFVKAFGIRNQSDRPPLHIWVVQRSSKVEKDRYMALFPRLHYHDRGLETFDFSKVTSTKRST